MASGAFNGSDQIGGERALSEGALLGKLPFRCHLVPSAGYPLRRHSSNFHTFAEADISHFGILCTFWLAELRHLLAEMGHSEPKAGHFRYSNFARRLAQIGLPPRFHRETLRLSVDRCTFG